jgi:hypothetical protein
MDNPLLMIALVMIGALIGVSVERIAAKRRRDAWRERNQSRWENKRGNGGVTKRPWVQEPVSTEPRQPDAADQLRIVMSADFTIQPLLNKHEARVFKELDRVVIACNPDWQVMAQVSVGEILRCQDAEAYRCINSKRIDLLLVDGDCQPRHAVEYQGSGHHQGTAAARDAVKKEALRRAGIGYHEVVAGHTTPSDLRRLVEKLVDKPKALG